MQCRSLEVGVVQGSVLEPLLYSILLYDIPQHPKTSLSMFADDTPTYSSSTNPREASQNIQQHANLMVKYFNTWKIKINAKKTEAIIFRYYKTKYKVNMSPVNIVINKCSVEYKEKIKYLGYWFQSNLKPNAHIDHTLSKGYWGGDLN